MLEVYLDPCTVNSRKVLAGLDLMGVKYDLKKVDYFKSEQKSDWYSKINPHCTVPSAKDGDLTITESNAILQYAADHGGKHEYYPQDLKQRALVNKWLLWEASVWFPTCYVYLVEYVVKPLLGAQPDESVISAEAEKFNKNAAILNDQLGKTKWLTGDTVTIADIAVAAPMHLHEAAKLPLEKYPNLNRWLTEQIEKLPEWQQTQGAVNQALLPGKSASSTTTSNGVNGASSNHSVRATFNYTKDLPNKDTELYFYDSPDAEGIHLPGDDAHEMSVHDGWHRASEFSVDKEGFSVHDFHSKYDNWEDEEQTRNQFYPDVVEFLKKTLGAKEVLVFDHTIRTQKNVQKKLTQETNTSQRAPVMLVHCDYTAESGPLRVQQLLGEEEGAEKLKRRVAFINVWKPIYQKVEERPLAMCDVTSSPTDDFFKLYLRYRDRTGENYVMRHNDQHKWWYFPGMTPEQVILLKTYESESDRARFVGHSAFEDPETRKDAKMRESCEIRTICFF
jgi:glutathione S-transferase